MFEFFFAKIYFHVDFTKLKYSLQGRGFHAEFL